MKIFAIVPNLEKDPQLIAAREIAAKLISLGVSVVMEEKFKGHIENITYYERDKMFSVSGFAVVVGGDGTILDIAPDVAGKDVHLAGINYGKLGFLSQAEKEDTDIFENILGGNYKTDSRMTVEAAIVKDGEIIKKFIALNDVVIFRGEYSRMIKLGLEIDDVFVESYAADGLIVATPTGSTAYSLSAGGPIVDPDIDCMTITPICPHTVSARSIVVPPSKTITVRLLPPYKMEGVVAVDGKEAYILNEGERIEVVQSPDRINLVKMPGKNFFNIIRTKLYSG